MNKFKTDSYNELEQWFQNADKSTLINAHLIEPLPTKIPSLVHSRPYILSAYGTNDKVNSTDVLRRWIYLYNECEKRNVCLVGFSTDCGPRYLKAMQLALGFFARAPNIDLISGNRNLLNIDIPQTWSFFLMRTKQAFLCMQDGTHLVTKVRNRLLSETATMFINDHNIDVNYLLYIVETYPNIDHNLVKSDIFPHDRQNYSSCLKITKDDVLNLSKQIDAKAIYTYLYLLKLIILAYVKCDTSIQD